MTSDHTEYLVDDVCTTNTHEKHNDSYCNEEAEECCQSLWKEAFACTSLWREAPRQTLANQACLREYGCFTPPQPLMKWGARLNHNTYAMQLLCGSLCRGVNPPQSWDGKHYKQWCSNDHIRSILSHFMIKEWAILMNKMYLIHL